MKHFVWYFAQLLILKSDVKHEMYNPCKVKLKNKSFDDKRNLKFVLCCFLASKISSLFSVLKIRNKLKIELQRMDSNKYFVS